MRAEVAAAGRALRDAEQQLERARRDACEGRAVSSEGIGELNGRTWCSTGG